MKRSRFLSFTVLPVFLFLLLFVMLSTAAYATPGNLLNDSSDGDNTAAGTTGTPTTSGSDGIGSVLSKYAQDGGGAAWVYYPWPAGQSEVRVNVNSDIAQSYAITGTDAQTCQQAGGYFVHGLISKKTHKQVGALKIGGNAIAAWNSVRLDGQTQYHTNYSTIVGGTGVSWAEAEAFYNDANARYGFSIPWQETAWFCSHGPSGGSLPPNSGDQTSIYTDVKVADRPFEGFSQVVYAGVGQTVRFRHVYYPNVQKYANKQVTVNNKAPGTWTCDSIVPPPKHYVGDAVPPAGGNIFYNNNAAFSNVVTFQNFFTINRGSEKGSFGGSFTGGSYSVGDSAQKIVYDDYYIQGNNLTDTIWENATTGYPTKASINSHPSNSYSWRCPYFKWQIVEKGGKCLNCPNCGDMYSDPYPCRCEIQYDTRCLYYVKDESSCKTVCNPQNPSECYTSCGQTCGRWETYQTGSTCDTCQDYLGYAPCQYSADKWDWAEKEGHSYGNANEFVSWSTNGTTTTSSQTARVLVPMNYALSSDIDLGSGVAYAGELLSVGNARVYNNARYNGVTGSTYATNAYGKYKLISYTSNRDETGSGWTASGNVCAGKANCIQGAESDGFWINANSSYPVNGKFGSINIPDIPAGNYICIALAYWPTDSGDYTNMGNYNGNGVWGVSNPACRVIAKKPTFQVWGGSLYTAGALSLPAAYKTSLAGVAGREYTINGRNNVTVFSSWVDQTVSGAKTVAELASGAATTGGSYEGAKAASGYCTFRTPLSLANWANNNPKLCPTALYTGSMPSSNVIDRKALAESLAKGNANVSTGTINLNNVGHYTTVKADSGRDVRYSYRSTGLTLQGGTVNAGVTHVVRSDADVVITGNIEYQNIAYSKLEQIPKLVIYAKNIKINCGVKRVDAVLLAESEINTCADSTDVNAQKNSNQLKINGIVVTNKLKLNRTYGAATGVNSAVPAEIIDYDTSLILWAAASATVSGSNNFNVTYQRELAPRY